MARHATPTRLKELASNPGKRPLNTNEPKAKGKLTQPKTLTPMASLIWKKVVNAMPSGLYQSVDEGILAAYCEAYSNHQAMSAQLVKDGLFSTGSMGQPVIHPALKEQSTLARTMLTLSAKLGFDPVSRIALSAQDDGEEENEFGIH